MVRSLEPAKWRRESQAGTGRSRTASTSRSHLPSRTCLDRPRTQAQPSRTPRGSAGCSVGLLPRPPRDVLGPGGGVLLPRSLVRAFAIATPALGPADLVLDQLEVLLRQLMDMSLEGERPVLGGPFPHVLEPVGQLLGQHPLDLLEDVLGARMHTPRVVLFATRAAPDMRVLLEHLRAQRGGGRERHATGDVVEQAVA